MKKKNLLVGMLAMLTFGLGLAGCATLAGSSKFFRFDTIDGEAGKTITITGYQGAASDVVIPAEINGIPVRAIGEKAFYNRSSLTSISIPDSVTAIGDYAFSICSKLTSISIPNSVTTIGSYAFSNCSKLTSISIPDSVTTIGTGAFYYCSSLTSINIPAGLTSLGASVFASCSSLAAITVDGNNGVYTAIDGVLFSKDFTALVQYPAGKAGAAYDIPDSVSSIGISAFYNCSKLTSVTIPDSVTTIGNYAFYGCSSLTGITIPDSVTTIGTGAFSGCNELIFIIIPANVSIGSSAFENDFGSSYNNNGKKAAMYLYSNGAWYYSAY
jgi:hypothetical protein